MTSTPLFAVSIRLSALRHCARSLARLLVPGLARRGVVPGAPVRIDPHGASLAARHAAARDLRALITLLAGLFAVAPAFAQNNWTGAADTTFSNPANWSTGSIPTGTGQFFTGTPSSVVLTSNHSLSQLSFISGNYTFSSSGGAVLTVSSQISNEVPEGSTTTFAANVAGAGRISQAGGGTLILSGANTFTGATTINAGTLQIGAGSTTGSLASSSIVNNAALAFNRTSALTYAGVVSGTGTLTKLGANTLTLTGANTYTGATTVSAGTLQFAKTTSLYNGTTGSWTAANLNVASGGTLALNVGGTGEFTTANVTTLLTNLTTGLNNNGLRAGASLGLDTTNAAGGTFTVADNLVDSTGTGGGAFGLTKLGTGTLTLTGTNTYSGPTTVNAGTLQIGDGGSTGSIAGPSIVNTANLAFNRSDALAYSGVISGTGTLTKLGAGTLTLSGVNTFTGPTTVSAGTLQIGDGGSTGSIASTSIVNNASLAFNRSDALAYSGAISGTGTLTKLGAGILTLSGANTFTGATTINAGTLLVNGSLAAGSAVTVNSGSTLGGSGTINGATTIASSGTLSPGNSAGLLTFGGALTLGSGATTNFQIDGPNRGVTYDAINVAGLMTYGGTLNLTFGTTFADATSLSLFGASGGTIGAFDFVTGSGSYSGSFANSGGVWTMTSLGQTLSFSQSTGTLSFAGGAVPEPSTYAALAGVAVLAVAAYRRRRVACAGSR